METFPDIRKPRKEEQEAALKSYDALAATLSKLKSTNPEIEIEETKAHIRIPLNALKLLAKILNVTSQGKPISIVPVATEMTTQAAVELLGCSRPHLVKLLERGEINFTKVGKHQWVLYEDVIQYKHKMKANQEQLIEEIMRSDEELGLYDT